MLAPPRAWPYIVGEIGFIVAVGGGFEERFELRDRLTERSESMARNVGMGCVEEVMGAGTAFVRILHGEELDEALHEFGYPDLLLDTV